MSKDYETIIRDRLTELSDEIEALQQKRVNGNVSPDLDTKIVIEIAKKHHLKQELLRILSM